MMNRETASIDAYIQQLTRQLRDLPKERREEIIAGIRDHFDVMVSEQGLSESEAMTRLGDPEQIAEDALSGAAPADHDERSAVRRARRMRRLGIIAGAASVPLVAVFIFNLLFRLDSVPSSAMIPTLRVGQHVLVSKTSHGGRDEVVAAKVATGPAGFKRIVAVGGDHVVVNNGDITVNSKSVRRGNSPVLTEDGKRYEITVPRGSVWLLGDNYANSLDSREFGPVASKDIIGKVDFTM